MSQDHAPDQVTAADRLNSLWQRLADRPAALAIARHLYQGPEGGDVVKLDADTLVELAVEAERFLTRRRPGTSKVELHTRLIGTVSGPAHATVVQIANDDMPFIVDSVMGELSARGLSANLVLHPVFDVERGPDGQLASIAAAAGGTTAQDRRKRESYIMLRLPPLGGAAEQDLVPRLTSCLGDVRAAVEDWPRMIAALDQAIHGLEACRDAIEPAQLAEVIAFARWLRDGQFTFLGMTVRRGADSATLGISRGTAGTPVALPVGAALSITKSRLISRVHRRVPMDYIALALYDAAGAHTGTLELLGLFTSQAYTQPPRAIPILKQKIDAVISTSGFPAGGHAAKALLNVLETFPRDELFRIEPALLSRWALAILDLDLRPRVRVLMRNDPVEHFASALLYIPRERFSSSIRQKAGDILAAAVGGEVEAFTPFFPDGPLVRVQFIISRPTSAPTEINEAALEVSINHALQTWSEQLVMSIGAQSQMAPHLIDTYESAFPPDYTDTFTPQRGMSDALSIERLSPQSPVAIEFYQGTSDGPGGLRAVVYRLQSPVSLSERVPVLENLGFRVIDERSYRITPKNVGPVALHDMLLEVANGDVFDLAHDRDRIAACFVAVLAGEAENDAFNRLVLTAGATWREAAVVRAAYAYLRQIRTTFGQKYVADTLARHGGITRDIIELFHLRFNPDLKMSAQERETRLAAVKSRAEGALAMVSSLDEDRILRKVMNLIDACVRTNVFQRDVAGTLAPVMAFKLDSKAVDELPEPRPYREIWVYAPRVEGIHLRFAPIARGGLRWSDRAQDFRTEVLGLCKAQQVKNTVIVPSGAKGGFLPKRLPRNGTRDEIMSEGVAAYKLFIEALLSVTDNIVEGHVIHPDGVLRHDGDDPYLVVAADKGTATFSDFANEISVKRGFWLGDAFASGGSAGYDHKKMGITARGAWECVKRHFREMDIDIQSTPIRVIGVGDMSGDVFGNGMLLSEQLKLVAAFDHRDIFLDPDPDPAATFAERRRLFDLPRSSWQDFDRSKLSAGGGIYARSAKAVPLTPQVRAMLGIDVTEITPSELIKAILKSPADLLWFGGIGTYVRGSTESDEQVGDKANDSLRVNATELNCKVIGEGANLGVTQRGRIEAAQRGVRVNADFIDNSAGVNTSDEEVNIKIALTPLVRSGQLRDADRLELLASMTGEIAAACLSNNYQQSLAITLAQQSSAREIGYLARLARVLEQRGLLDRRLEVVPTRSDFAQRQSAGTGLTRPEIAVLLSWAKIALDADLLASKAPEDPALHSLLLDYFPPEIRERARSAIEAHPLKREIVATRITNSMINRGGPAMVIRLMDETGRTAEDVAYAFLAARAAFGLPELWQRLDGLDLKVAGSVQLELYANTQAFLLEATAGLLRRPPGTALADTIAACRPAVEDLASMAIEVCTPAQKQRASERLRQLEQAGVPASVADRLAILPVIIHAPAVVDLMALLGSRADETARTVLATSDFFRTGELEARGGQMKLSDYYDRLALNSALGALKAAGRKLAAQVLRQSEGAPVDVTAWVEGHAPGLVGAKAILDEIADSGDLTVSRLTVAAAQVRDHIEG